MRIGFGCTMIEPGITQGQIDGVGYYTKFLLEELTQLQQQVSPYSFPPLKQPRFTSGLTNGKTFKLPYMAATGLSILTPKILTTHSALEKNIDIFHATDHLVPKLKKTRVIATLHDALIMKHPEWFGARFRTVKNWTRRKSMQWADHIITISHSMVSEMVQYWGIPEEKISVVYNGLVDWWFEKVSAAEKQRVIAKLGIPENFLLVVGTLQPKKNVARIIDAFLQLPVDIRERHPLVIVGKAGWNTEESLAAIERLTESRTGYWLRYLSDDDLRTLFQTTRLYLHPSLHEGFGLTILQAFASNSPVLTSNITAMPEIAGDAALLVDPYSVNEIAQAMLKLLTNETLCAELVSKGAARAKQFSWKKCATETLKIYQQIL